MAEPNHETPRRGLSTGPIRRGATALAAIRAVRLVRRGLWHLLEVLLALVILFEEWGWRPLSAALATLARIDLVARLEMGVRALPPWPALGVFLVPSLLFLPLKLASLWLIANGQTVAATLLFAFAKVAGTALYARIFQLTQPALMRLGWFARLYGWFVPWKEALVAHVRQSAVWRAGAALKARAKVLAGRLWLRLRPAATAAIQRLRAAFGL